MLLCLDAVPTRGRMCWWLSRACALALPLAAADAQGVPRSGYLDHLPPTPRIVAQTAASARLSLYGDPSDPAYVDRAPADGIDDLRAARLLAIAERFSPILRRNTFLVPRDVWWVLGSRPVLEIDTWVDSHLARTDSIILPSSAAATDSGRELPPPDQATEADESLRRVIAEFAPDRVEPFASPAGARETRVLFFDTPGRGQKTWRAAYAKRGHTGSRIYAHFFVADDSGSGGPDRYVVAVQFWFFYPFNDGANNHEGDWEHINVHLTTRSAAGASGGESRAALLTAEAVTAMLDGTTPLEEIVIRAVDYYFHHNVVTLDYLTRPPRSHAAEGAALATSSMWVDHDYPARVVRKRAEAYGGRLSTHPIGYIGGNNKGLDELYHMVPRSLWSYNRNSGATYPFPGTWQTVGPLGATETVWGRVVPRPSELGDRYLTYTKSDIELLPDWERIAPLARDDIAVRTRWAWFVLPVRWGYPASESPAAGVVRHADMGNLAPLGPAFTPSWNRLGQSSSHAVYAVKPLRMPVSPLVPWAVLQSGWGLLNYPLVITELYPFYNTMSGHMSPWALPVVEAAGLKLPRTFVSRVPKRFATVGGGLSMQVGGARLARPLLRAAPSDSGDVGAEAHALAQSASVAPRIWYDLHFGRGFFVENSFSASRSAVGYVRRAAGSDAGVRVRGQLDARRFTGGVRTALPAIPQRDDIAVFGRVGYGWTRYTVSDVSVDGRPAGASVKGGYMPSFFPGRRSWPNMLYSGLTLEYFCRRSTGLFNRFRYGARVDAGGTLQRMPSGEVLTPKDIYVRQGELAIAATLGW